MNLLLYYEPQDAAYNAAFIHELQTIGKERGHTISLHTQLPAHVLPASLVFFRSRSIRTATQFVQHGWQLVNPLACTVLANNKWKTYQFARQLQIPTIPTYLIKGTEQITEPMICKTIHGHGGTEVHLIQTTTELHIARQTNPSATWILQPFITTTAVDIRVFLLHGQCIGAVKRTGTHSFKSNYTLGGSIEWLTPIPLPLQQAAEKIAQALGSTYIGVDFLLTDTGDYVLNEIEDPVGARSLYQLADFPVTEKLFEALEKRQKM